MCETNRLFFIIVLVFCALSCVVGVLRAEEQGRWYLISEAELTIIERYKATSEAEKQSWLSQAASLNQKLRNSEAKSAGHELTVKHLNQKLQNSEAKSAGHELTVKNLNGQLAVQRETNRKLEQSFGALEAGWSRRLSLKNGEIIGLQQTVSDRTMEAEKYKGTSRIWLVVVFVLAGSWIVFIAFKVCRFFKLI